MKRCRLLIATAGIFCAMVVWVASCDESGTDRELATETPAEPNPRLQEESASATAEETANHDSAEARVTGTEARIDLGTIAAGSEHRMAFHVRNEKESPIRIRKITRDCECIRAVNPPETLEPGDTTIDVVFEAPKVAVPYKTRLVLVTDAPDRRLISLWVNSRTVKE